jgi:C-terminal processing protease CtpA/Prc
MKSPLFVASLIAVLIAPASSQTKMRMIQREGTGSTRSLAGEPFMLRELGAIMVQDSSALRVVTVAPAQQRPAAYRDVDLREDDVIALVNGKRTPGSKAIKEIYDGLKVGETFTMGVRRGEERLLVSLSKADPATLPHMKLKVMSQDDNSQTFPAVGVELQMKGKSIVISKVLPGKTAVSSLDVKTGDVIVSINGRACATLEDYANVYDDTPIGRPIIWVLKRGSTEHDVTFDRPQPKVIIRKEGSSQ